MWFQKENQDVEFWGQFGNWKRKRFWKKAGSSKRLLIGRKKISKNFQFPISKKFQNLKYIEWL